MVFNFRIVSDEVDNFRREIQIDADATFLDFKNAICDSVNYDKNQMCSFFLCDENWEKEKEITMEDMGTDSDEDVYLMDETILSDYIDDEGQRLIFTFDYLADRSFFIELKEIVTRKNLRDPLCTLSKGEAPSQLTDIEEFEAKVNATKKDIDSTVEDFGEDFYGSEGYNDDEMDPEAFDEMTYDQ